MEREENKIYVYNHNKKLIYVTGGYTQQKDALMKVSDFLLVNYGLDRSPHSLLTRMLNDGQIGGKYGFYLTETNKYKTSTNYLVKYNGELPDTVLKDLCIYGKTQNTQKRFEPESNNAAVRSIWNRV